MAARHPRTDISTPAQPRPPFSFRDGPRLLAKSLPPTSSHVRRAIHDRQRDKDGGHTTCAPMSRSHILTCCDFALATQLHPARLFFLAPRCPFQSWLLSHTARVARARVVNGPHLVRATACGSIRGSFSTRREQSRAQQSGAAKQSTRSGIGAQACGAGTAPQRPCQLSQRHVSTAQPHPPPTMPIETNPWPQRQQIAVQSSAIHCRSRRRPREAKRWPSVEAVPSPAAAAAA